MEEEIIQIEMEESSDSVVEVKNNHSVFKNSEVEKNKKLFEEIQVGAVLNITDAKNIKKSPCCLFFGENSQIRSTVKVNYDGEIYRFVCVERLNKLQTVKNDRYALTIVKTKKGIIVQDKKIVKPNENYGPDDVKKSTKSVKKAKKTSRDESSDEFRAKPGRPRKLTKISDDPVPLPDVRNAQPVKVKPQLKLQLKPVAVPISDPVSDPKPEPQPDFMDGIINSFMQNPDAKSKIMEKLTILDVEKLKENETIRLLKNPEFKKIIIEKLTADDLNKNKEIAITRLMQDPEIKKTAVLELTKKLNSALN